MRESAESNGVESADPILRTARERFGVPYLFPYQRLVVANVIEAVAARAAPHLDDVDARSRQLVILPTGSGKSLCFQLPAVLSGGLTVVVYPLLSLIADQKRKLDELSIPCESLTGRSTGDDRLRVAERLRRGSLSLLLTNPETLIRDHTRELLRGVTVSHLVIDEAHTVVQWGESFRPAYLELGGALEWLEPAVTTGFTATASPEVIARIDQHLFGGEGYHLVRGNPDRPNIHYAVAPVASKAAALRELLRRAEPAPIERPPLEQAPTRRPAIERAPVRRPAVVFCRTRGRCERTALELRRALDDPEIKFYHAGLSKQEKTALEAWFLASPDGVLIATCAYGMGVDKRDIRTIIHRDLPDSVEAYLQESGRAGRDGGPAQAVVLASPSEMATAASTAGTQWSAFLSGRRCRRAVLVEALGAEPEACSGCDVCDGAARADSALTAAILRWLSRRRRRYTPAQAAAVLAGTARTAPVPWSPELEPTWSLLAEWTREEIEEALEEIRAGGRLRVIKRGPWRGRVVAGSDSGPSARWTRLARTY